MTKIIVKTGDSSIPDKGVASYCKSNHHMGIIWKTAILLYYCVLILGWTSLISGVNSGAYSSKNIVHRHKYIEFQTDKVQRQHAQCKQWNMVQTVKVHSTRNILKNILNITILDINKYVIIKINSMQRNDVQLELGQKAPDFYCKPCIVCMHKVCFIHTNTRAHTHIHTHTHTRARAHRHTHTVTLNANIFDWLIDWLIVSLWSWVTHTGTHRGTTTSWMKQMNRNTREAQATYAPNLESTCLEYWEGVGWGNWTKTQKVGWRKICVSGVRRDMFFGGRVLYVDPNVHFLHNAGQTPGLWVPSSPGRAPGRSGGTSWRVPSAAGRCSWHQWPGPGTRPPHPQGSGSPACFWKWNA